MITKFRTAKRYWSHVNPITEVTFVRETKYMLIDSKGRKTYKNTSYEKYHDTRQEAELYVGSIKSAQLVKDRLSRIAAYSPLILEALESVTSDFSDVCENCDLLTSDFPSIKKALQVIKEVNANSKEM